MNSQKDIEKDIDAVLAGWKLAVDSGAVSIAETQNAFIIFIGTRHCLRERIPAELRRIAAEVSRLAVQMDAANAVDKAHG